MIYLKVKAGIRWHDASMVCSAPCAGVSLDSSLVRKYDGFGPRYTSYPTADRFTEAFTADDLVDALLNRQAASAPLSLYVHVPFCSTICYYCACNKVLTKDHGRSAKYIRYLVKEVAILSALVSPKAPIMQLHWGGGTPTFLSADEMQLLMHALRDNFRFERHAELAIEIDPRTADAETRDRLSRQPIDQIDVD